jgi:hypothetical protein
MFYYNNSVISGESKDSWILKILLITDEEKIFFFKQWLLTKIQQIQEIFCRILNYKNPDANIMMYKAMMDHKISADLGESRNLQLWQYNRKSE